MTKPKAKPFLVLDFEFTHYKRAIGRPRGFFAEIIEIGAVKIDPVTYDEIGSIQNFVKPHFFPKQSVDTMEFCSITEADMKTAITFKAMMDKLNDMYTPGETYIVAWGGEDFNVLKTGCKNHHITNPILQADYVDLADAYRKLHNDSYTTSLTNTAKELGIEIKGHSHAAYDDAALTAKILIKLMEHGYRPANYPIGDLTRLPLT